MAHVEPGIHLSHLQIVLKGERDRSRVRSAHEALHGQSLLRQVQQMHDGEDIRNQQAPKGAGIPKWCFGQQGQ